MAVYFLRGAVSETRYRITRSKLIVTKPDGQVVQREVMLHHDSKLDTFGITLVGESQLKGFTFEVTQGEFHRVRDAGDQVVELPKIN